MSKEKRKYFIYDAVYGPQESDKQPDGDLKYIGVVGVLEVKNQGHYRLFIESGTNTVWAVPVLI